MKALCSGRFALHTLLLFSLACLTSLASAQTALGLTLNTTQCQGVFNFSVNTSRLSTTESNVTWYDERVKATLDSLPVWLTVGCKESLRSIECMSVFGEPLGVAYCKSDCEARLARCDSFLHLLHKGHKKRQAEYNKLASSCDGTSTNLTCVSSGQVSAYEDDETVCPLVCALSPLLPRSCSCVCGLYSRRLWTLLTTHWRDITRYWLSKAPAAHV